MAVILNDAAVFHSSLLSLFLFVTANSGQPDPFLTRSLYLIQGLINQALCVKCEFLQSSEMLLSSFIIFLRR